ncbi:MAG: polysaccharide export protein [Methylococcaceae bacterium]|nr:polysaccharide export protein [Methylococcaceae bacterium]
MTHSLIFTRSRITRLSVIEILVFILLSHLAGNAWAGDKAISDYKLGAGDKIKVFVFDEQDLSQEYILSDAGSFSYPFLGEIKAKGMTLNELEKVLTERLKQGYLVSPRVNVRILEYRQFFINGEVKQPGGYPFLPGLTVQKAVALAGGFTERASRRSINVIHDDDTSQTTEEIELNSPVHPGDIIMVEESFF